MKQNEKAAKAEKSEKASSQPMISDDALNQLKELYKKSEEQDETTNEE